LPLSNSRFLSTVLATLVILSFLSLAARGQAFGASESVLWNFGSGTDGVGPEARLIMDTSGKFYGTTTAGGTFGKGTVFELTPPAASGGNWTESILWSFGNGSDGNGPSGSLIMDPSGNLFGATVCGGLYGNACNGGTVSKIGGTVFELTRGGCRRWKLDRVNPVELRQRHRRQCAFRQPDHGCQRQSLRRDPGRRRFPQRFLLLL
jgi:uncharacterized repeat protein (TIGR03803 family)